MLFFPPPPKSLGTRLVQVLQPYQVQAFEITVVPTPAVKIGTWLDELIGISNLFPLRQQDASQLRPHLECSH